jgi:drug/metabolite transporter (DMT)-like permease
MLLPAGALEGPITQPPLSTPPSAGRRVLSLLAPEPGRRLSLPAVYGLLAFAILAMGVNWPVMATALKAVSPWWMASIRLVAASITMFAIVAATGRLERPPRQDLPIVASVATFRLALVFLLVFSGLEIVPPGRSSILVWTASLWTIPFAVVVLGERMNRLRWIGLASGMAGILLVFDPTRLDWTEGRVILGHLLLLGAAISQAGVSVHVRRHRWASSPFRLMPWQLLVACVPVTAVALAVDGLPSIDWSAGLIANLAFQGIVVSGFAILAQMTVLLSHPAISTNLILMAVPVVGLLSSVVFVGETLTAALVAGMLLVLGGVAAARLADSR